MTKPIATGHSAWPCLAAVLFLLAASPAVAQSDLDRQCKVPAGESADAIVNRVQKRLDGNWDLALRTLRQTIARQQRLGQDTAPAEAYLATLECLQTATGGGSVASGQPQQGEAEVTYSAPGIVGPASQSSVPATNDRPSPQQTTASAPPAASAQPAPAPQTQPQPASPSAGPSVGQPVVLSGLVLPGTPESYGQRTSATVPPVRSLDGGSVVYQSGSGTGYSLPTRPQATLLVPPSAPKGRGSSLQALATAQPAPAAKPSPSPQPETAPAPAPQSSPKAEAPPPADTPPAAATTQPPPEQEAARQGTLGDPRYLGRACLYFTRPEYEVVRNRVYTNRHPSGAQVCYEDVLYACQGGVWRAERRCSADADAELSATRLEAQPRR